MRTLIRNGRVVDPGNIDGIMDILVENGKISKIIDRTRAASDLPSD